MTKNLSSLAAGLIALLVASSPALAVGTAARTFVSGVGSDAGACPVNTPCRTFAYALTQTAPSGEIIVLTSAGYGTVIINQAISIINTSNFAGITVASGNGITINAGVNDSVTLRGLTIDGGGTGANGIVLNSGGKLTIDQCNVMNFVGGVSGIGNGIFMQPTSGSHNIIITNTNASNNQNTGVIYTASGTAVTGFVIDHVNANNNGAGLAFVSSDGAVSASISSSVASENQGYGYTFSGLVVAASLDFSYASGNQGGGVSVANMAQLSMGRSVLANDNVGVLIASGATVNSYKDNRVSGTGDPVLGGTVGTATPF
jgi:hypothetical protein